MERKPLTGIIPSAANSDDLARLFDEAEATPDPTAQIPPGVYPCVIERGQLDKNHKGTDRFAIRFAVAEGPHAGRKLFHDLFLTKASVKYTKAKLKTLGVTTYDEMVRGLVAGRIRCAVTVAARAQDNGRTMHEVKSFSVTEITEDTPNPFPLEDEGGDQ